MVPEAGNLNCYEYLKKSTSIFGDVYMMQHFGVKYMKSKIFADIEALAAYFKCDLGLNRGDVYTVFMPTTVQSIIAFYALNKIGVIANFVHPLMSTEFLKETINDVHSKGVMVLDILSKDHAKTINESGLPCLVCCSSDYSKGVKRFGTKLGEGIVKGVFPKIKKATYYKNAIRRHRECPGLSENADDIAVYLNGGGTTGKSKTIKLTSRAINEFVYRVSDLDEIHIPGEEAEIVVLPMFHCFGLCLGVHMAMCNSARIIPMMQFDARLFNKLMRKNLVVGFMGIPLMFQKLMKEKHFDGPWLKNVRLMFCGGDDVSDSFLDEFNSYFEKWGAVGRLRQGYGLTEAASACCTNTNWDNRPGSIGKPLRGVDIEIWDDDHKKVPNGTIGEIAISGPTIMAGYYVDGGEDDLGLYTDENGKKWVLSGDLAYYDDDGYLFFSGRKKRVIIIAGYNVYPNDIEKMLVEKLDFVREACAVQAWHGERSVIKLYVSLKKKGDEEEYKRLIREACESNFSKFSVPREIEFLDELPQTPLMKIDFMKLTEMAKDSDIKAAVSA
ncbi:MAG: class I adenylate-forming enzyme family protein [Acutalibacteraceae bacterium]|nr:class I adenylate-forming enzyme family protein [Oscillospiraceae bacterium]